MAGESELVTPFGKRIRQFFRDLFGSRVSEHLEIEKIQLRQDYEKRLLEKDTQIASLREEKALLTSKITVYELTLLPHASRSGAEVVAYSKPKKPSFSFVDTTPVKSRWQQYQEDYAKAEEEKEVKEKQEKAAAAAKE